MNIRHNTDAYILDGCVYLIKRILSFELWKMTVK